MTKNRPKLVRCKKCSYRIIDYGVGFSNEKTTICAYFDKEVDNNDGCTFGSKGKSRYSIKRPYSIDLGFDSATSGCHYD